jgi:protein TonB
MSFGQLSAAAVLVVAAAMSSSISAQSTDTPLKLGPGVESPRLVNGPKPSYTRDAKKKKIQGVVALEAVVLPTGKVGEVRVTRSLDKKYGLDLEAIRTVQRWEFEPATKDGKPVAVWVDVELSFTLK